MDILVVSLFSELFDENNGDLRFLPRVGCMRLEQVRVEYMLLKQVGGPLGLTSRSRKQAVALRVPLVLLLRGT